MTEQISVEEQARRKAKIVASIASLIAEAKSLLQDAKQIGKDNDIEVSFDEMMQELSEDTYWYGSDQSLC